MGVLISTQLIGGEWDYDPRLSREAKNAVEARLLSV
jgi:hypothetical protein